MSYQVIVRNLAMHDKIYTGYILYDSYYMTLCKSRTIETVKISVAIRAKAGGRNK